MKEEVDTFFWILSHNFGKEQVPKAISRVMGSTAVEDSCVVFQSNVSLVKKVSALR